ncbi:hypothetical protein Tco_0839876 [Tanacetum coccineum]|uniref:Uncharacterized protein n=1 Tax=Tanacetum coccineum TaxID=301880 RepID=A0ABQ5AWD9_9ASTR
MLDTGKYSQWLSRFLRYIGHNMNPNGEGLRKSILSGPYVPSTVLVQAVAATECNPAIQQHTTIETVLNMTPENKEHLLSEKEAIFLLLTGIGDDIYSTVDACKTANEIWIAIERLQQAVSKQYQNEVNDIRAKRIAKSANPLALLAAAQPYSDNYYQAPKPQRSNATSSSTRPSASTRHKSKEITKPITPQYESMSKEDSDHEQAQTDMDMQKNLALLAKNKTEDTTPRQSGTDTDEEIDEHELEAHYSFMAKIQEVLSEESSSTEEPLEQVQNNDENNVFANKRQHSENNTAECVDECVALANLIANLTLDTEENKMFLKQLKKANASLTQELEECKTNLDETSRALGEATSCRDRLLALKDIEIKEGLKTKAYEILVLNQKHDELVKKSLLTKSQLEGYLKEKTKVISDLKVKEEKDIDKMIEMDKQLKFLNEIVYTRNQSIQTIHMLAPKCSTYNGRPTFANPRYLKKAQSEKPCLYEIPYDNSDHANRFAPDREETMTLANESRSKLNKDY